MDDHIRDKLKFLNTPEMTSVFVTLGLMFVVYTEMVTSGQEFRYYFFFGTFIVVWTVSYLMLRFIWFPIERKIKSLFKRKSKQRQNN